MYAALWRRLIAAKIDLVLLFVVAALITLPVGGGEFHHIYLFVITAVVEFLFYVYLVKRYGATPGKQLMRIRIVKVNDEAVSYREAFLRYLPELMFKICGALYILMHVLDIVGSSSDLDGGGFAAISYKPLEIAYVIWFLVDCVTILINQKKRAIHDFIAGTVVVTHAQIKQ